MILLQVQQISKYFGAEMILNNIKLEVKTNDRIALVGRNGAGKSTLLKIIAGELSYDGGTISKPKQVKIGYLAQNTSLESSRTIWEEMLTVFEDLRQMEQKLREIELKMADPDNLKKESYFESLLKQYDVLQHNFKEQGGYQYEADIRSILHGFRFYDADYEKPVKSLSGGQKTRLALAKLLLSKQDILILDEPTNHLDIETLTWLENYLQNYRGALLIVSHDRYFLDKVVNQVYEISRTKIDHFTGNYSSYLIQKQVKLEKEWKDFDQQQKQIAKLEDFVARNIVRASTTKRAQSRRKQLEKLDRLDRPEGNEKSAHFGFHFSKATGKDVLKTHDLAIGYDPKYPTASNINFEAKQADSIAIVGPNGIGKTTLLKTLIKLLPPLAGDFVFGAGVQIGYYDQEQTNLTSNKTVLAEVWDDFPDLTEQAIRNCLGSFLFSEDDCNKVVHSLSGGEKARLALSKLTLLDANVLILDEPTNHLDIDSKEVLETALIQFEGTILFVSHDRYFINRIASKVLELSSQTVTTYLGDYDYYLQKLAEEAEIARLDAEEAAQKQLTNLTIKKTITPTSKKSYHLDKEKQKEQRKWERRLTEIEQSLEESEKQITTLETLLTEPEIYQNHEKVYEINTELEKQKATAEKLMTEWENVSEQLEQ